MKKPAKNPPIGQKNRIALPKNLSARLSALADDMGCSFDELLVKTVTRGLETIQAEHTAARSVADLSPRQSLVLQGLRDGHSIKELADRLLISEATVRTHIVRIRERFNCPDLLKLRMP